MSYIRYIIIFLGLFVTATQVHSESVTVSKALSPIATITWRHYHLIDIAMAEVRKADLNVDNYLVSITELSGSFLVEFYDSVRAPVQDQGLRWGNQGKGRAFEVEISKVGFKVIRSNFQK